MRDGTSSGDGVGGGGSGESVVYDFWTRQGSCGYCRSPGYTSINNGLRACSLTVDDYQELLDQGWRRAGSFLYKPEMENTCCPSYTIRLNTGEFIPSREQDRVSKKMRRYLDGTLDMKKTDQSKSKQNVKRHSKILHCSTDNESLATKSPLSKQISTAAKCGNKEDDCVDYLSNKINDAVEACFGNNGFTFTVQLPKAVVKKVTARKKLMGVSEDLLYTSNISFQVAAAVRHLSNCGQTGQLSNSASQNGELLDFSLLDFSPNTVSEKLASVIDQQGESSGLSIRACNGHLNFYSTTEGNGSVHVSADAGRQTCREPGGSLKRTCTANASAALPHERRKLEILMKRSSFDPEEFALYRKYQIKVHNEKPEKVTESSYKKFLVDTPLLYVPPCNGNKTIPPCGFGSFHQQYVIDGKLVAVGVIDILPKCLSSKYLFWDPDLAFLSLGKYSALEEINWVKKAKVNCSSLQYYYLGYYVHSCSKMRYKARYRPSELLCPLRFEWVPFDIARPLLDKKSYVVLSDYAAFPNGIPSPQVPNSSMRQSPGHDSQNEDSSEEDEEMELDFEALDTSADDESGQEISSGSMNYDLQSTDINNIVIDLNGSRTNFKDLLQVSGPNKKRHMDLLELQLHRYALAVGRELSSRMIYLSNILWSEPN